MVVELSFGHFIMQIYVLNCLLPFDIEERFMIGKGTFGSIYHAMINKKRVAIKCLNIK